MRRSTESSWQPGEGANTAAGAVADQQFVWVGVTEEPGAGCGDHLCWPYMAALDALDRTGGTDRALEGSW